MKKTYIIKARNPFEAKEKAAKLYDSRLKDAKYIGEYLGWHLYKERDEDGVSYYAEKGYTVTDNYDSLQKLKADLKRGAWDTDGDESEFYDGDFDLGNRSRLSAAQTDITKALTYARRARIDVKELPYDDLTAKKAEQVIECLEELQRMIEDDENYQSEYGDR